MVSLVDSAKWAPLIGRMFIAFGHIEYTTHECIRNWAGEQIHRHFAKTRLSARIDLAQELAKSQQATEATKEAFCRSLLLARSLAEKRNHIAHNPLCLMFLQDTREQSFIEAIAHNTERNKLVSYEQLAEIVASAERCADELLHNFLAFRAQKLDVKSHTSSTDLDATHF